MLPQHQTPMVPQPGGSGAAAAAAPHQSSSHQQQHHQLAGLNYHPSSLLQSHQQQQPQHYGGHFNFSLNSGGGPDEVRHNFVVGGNQSKLAHPRVQPNHNSFSSPTPTGKNFDSSDHVHLRQQQHQQQQQAMSINRFVAAGVDGGNNGYNPNGGGGGGGGGSGTIGGRGKSVRFGENRISVFMQDSTQALEECVRLALSYAEESKEKHWSFDLLLGT